MRHLTALALALGLVASACASATTETSAPPVTTAAQPTTPPTPPATTAPAATTTTTTLAPVVGTSLADVVAPVQADLDFIWSVGDHPAGVPGPYIVTCDHPESVPARLGDVFACPGIPQTEGAVTLDEVGVLMMVVADDGTARWLSGTDIPADIEQVRTLHAAQAGSHFYRELRAEGGHPFDLGYLGAVLYWFLDGMPERMDADGDGVPCETVFSHAEVLQVWGGTDHQAFLEDPRDGYQFAFVTEIAPDGSSVTLDYADFLSGTEANEAAVAAGEIPEGETVPNDYYIRNENPLLRTLPLDSVATIELIGYYFDDSDQGLEGIEVTPDEWATLLVEAQDCFDGCNLGGATWGWYGGGFLPYWVLIEDGVIVAVEEQYLP